MWNTVQWAHQGPGAYSYSSNQQAVEVEDPVLQPTLPFPYCLFLTAAQHFTALTMEQLIHQWQPANNTIFDCFAVHVVNQRSSRKQVLLPASCLVPCPTWPTKGLAPPSRQLNQGTLTKDPDAFTQLGHQTADKHWHREEALQVREQMAEREDPWTCLWVDEGLGLCCRVSSRTSSFQMQWNLSVGLNVLGGLT